MAPGQVDIKLLNGRRILWTCPQREGRDGIDRLIGVGAQVDAIPLIKTQAMPFALPESPAVFDWLFFTSQNGVRAFYDAVSSDLSWRNLPVATVGPVTAHTVEAYGIQPKYIAPQFDAESAALHFSQTVPCQDLRVLWPCGNLASPQLADALTAVGAQVTPQIVYETTQSALSPVDLQALEQAFEGQGFDCLVFSSPSAVQAFVQLAKNYHWDTASPQIACLGPRTAQAAKDLLGRCTIQPPAATFESLVDAIHSFYKERLILEATL